MGHRGATSDMAFNSIPIELNKLIAHFLDADKDIANFRLICRATNSAIDADHRSFWRAKFREQYDFKEGVSNTRLMKLYQRRAKHLRNGARYDFFRGHGRHEQCVLLTLRDLIVESFQDTTSIDEHGRPFCKNQAQLLNFVKGSKILFNNRRAPPPVGNEPKSVNPLLAAVKLICSQFLFEVPDANHQVFAIEDSQRAVYLATNAAPIFKGPTHQVINVEWILHCMNFFRHHMMCVETATLFDNINDLPVTQKPSKWQEALRYGSYPLSQSWKGTYSYLHWPELKKLRHLGPDESLDVFISDNNIDEGKIQSLTLHFDNGDAEKRKWPASFERYLQSLRNSALPSHTTQGRTRSKGKNTEHSFHNIPFTGVGEDLEDDFYALGWLNPLPEQEGIPGWMRITFMKHFMDDVDMVEQDNLWAYEGVVLPGGRIILGRWWFCNEDTDLNDDYNGPFILWATDPEPELIAGKNKE